MISTTIPVDPNQLIQSVHPDIFFTNGQNPGPKTYQGTNIFFLGSGSSKIMIDAGQSVPEYERNLTKIIESEKITVSSVIITHFHHDHTTGIKYVLEKFPAVKIYKLEGKEEESRNFDEKLQNEYGFKYAYVQDQDVLCLEGYNLKILHLPGHSDDSIGIYDVKSQRLFIGDTILGEGSGTLLTNLSAYMRTLQLLLLTEIETLLPAHGGMVLGKDAVNQHVKNYYDNRMRRELKIKEVLKSMKSGEFEEVFQEVYKGTPSNLIAFARFNFTLHINKLVEEQSITRKTEGDKVFLSLE